MMVRANNVKLIQRYRTTEKVASLKNVKPIRFLMKTANVKSAHHIPSPKLTEKLAQQNNAQLRRRF